MSGSRKTLSRKKKVKILQLYEPKIEEPGNRKQSKKQRDLKNLSNQVKSKFQNIFDISRLNSQKLQNFHIEAEIVLFEEKSQKS